MTTNLYEQSCQAWLTKPKVIGKDDLLNLAYEQGRYPSPEEEAALRGTLESASIPEEEWGAVCLLVERIRQRNAEQDLSDEASEQIAEAVATLDYGAERYLKWPWKALHDLTGAMAPGTVHIVACPSKGGKTTLMRSATELWARQGERIYFGGFEMPAKMLRSMFAADECGVDPGDIVTGAWLHRADKDVLRLRLREAFQRQEDPTSHYQNIAYSSETNVTPQAVRAMMQTAADWGARCVILDHLENVTGVGNGFQNASAVCHLLADLAKKLNLVVIGTSQLNTPDKRHDIWRDHRPLRHESVAYGNVKMQVATTMFGFVRPVRPGLTKQEKAEVEAREKTVYECLSAGVNEANLIASRPYASRIGQRALLGWKAGRIVDADPSVILDHQAGRHGIKTSRGI